MTSRIFPTWLITSTHILVTVSGNCAPQHRTPKLTGPSGMCATPKTTLDALWIATRQNQQSVLKQLNRKQFKTVQWVAERILHHVRQGQKTQAFDQAKAFRAFGLFAIDCELPDGEQILALADTRGANGAYLFRFGQHQTELILQSPHRFFDTATGIIARRIFASAPLRAFFFNTGHRFGKHQEQPKKEKSNDVASADKTVFSAFSLAAANTFESPLVMQLHGFANNKKLAEVDAIVSSGATSASQQVIKVSSILQSAGAHVLRYPTQIDILGGEENAIGRQLAEQNVPFIHVELGEAFRSRLRKNATSKRLGSALAQAFARRVE